MTANTKRPRLAARLLLSLSVLLFAVAAAEAAYRLRYFGLGGFVPERLDSLRALGDSGFVRDAEFPRVEYELRPDLRAWLKLVPFETSSDGLRDHEYAREKPEGTFRIAVIGDSYTMGSGVRLEEVYHSVLEERLNAESDGTTYECLNFGVGGYGLMHYAGVLEHKALAWDPDLILIGMVYNDRTPPSLAYLAELLPDHPEIPRQPKRKTRERAPGRSFLRLTMLEPLLAEPVETEDVRPRLLEKSARLGALAATETGPVPKTYEQAVLARIGRLADAAGARVFCVYLSTSPPSEDSPRRLEKAARQLGFGFLDTCPLFEGTESGEFAILPTDGHPDGRAHAMYADALRDALMEGSYLPD